MNGEVPDTENKSLPLDDVIMSEADCAVLIGVATATLINLRRRGDGPPYFQVTRATVRYSKTRVLEWLQARIVEGAIIKTVEE